MEKVKNQKLKLLVSELVQKKIKSGEDFLVLTGELTKKLKLASISFVTILNFYKDQRRQNKIKKNYFFEQQLKKRPIRSLSGVAVVSVLTKPYFCPGQCLYCPTEKGLPKSYLSGEPVVERAKFLKFNPYQQVKKRIENLQETGHPTDKIELIVIGASWSAYPKKYQEWFIKRCFEGANEVKSKIKNQKPKIQIKNKKYLKSKSLQEIQRKNEKTRNRIIGISVETRPDLITPEEVKRMRQLGVTKVELGVQCLDEKILAKNQRGHGLQEVIRTTKLLKNAGFKICYHWMLNLPGSNPKRDLAMFKKLFFNQNFQPDYLKIYPCVVTGGSALYQLWRKRKYRPYTKKTLINLLIKMKKIVPPYVRIIRVFRDIPAPKIMAGTKISNIREIVQKEMQKRGLRCRCLRCREIKNWRLEIRNLKLVKKEYRASNGKEIFLSFEDKKQDKILSFLRLRLPEKFSINRTIENSEELKIYKYFSVLKNAALIRELHTYGPLVKIGKKERFVPQHQNLGRRLIQTAEKLAKKFGYKKIAVIAGVGARPYWRRLGYRLQQTYQVKKI